MRVLLIDDHGVLRAGARSLIQQAYPGAFVVEASSYTEALSTIKSTQYDIIFLDLAIPENTGTQETSAENGISLLRLLKGDSEPSSPLERIVYAPVIVMSAEDDEARVNEVLRLGASSFVSKSASPGMMLDAIQHVLHGGIYLPEKAQIDLNDEIKPSFKGVILEGTALLGPNDLGITPREFDILRLALQGNAPWKIAVILEINPTNVRRYLSKLYAKFGVLDLCGLQSFFAKTGQVLGIIAGSDSTTFAARPISTSI